MADEPKLVLSGVFTLYETPDGGYHISYRPTDCDEDQHLEVPGKIVSMARTFTGAHRMNPLALLARMGR